MKKIKISVTGLGYVGLQVALAFSKKFYTIGYDINKERIKNLQNNVDLTNEVSFLNLKKSSLVLTNKISELKSANFHIIAVPTPIDTKKNPDLRIIKDATKNISQIIKKGDIIVYESTVYPGLTEDICIPILERFTKLKSNKDFYVGYSPERINPGDKKNNYHKINKIVSAQNKKILELMRNIYQLSTRGKVIKVDSIKIAEAAKVIENTQRDLNVALINEFSLIFNKMNIDTYAVLKAASSKWNFLNFKPGLVGGHCIGVDPYYLTYKSKKIGLNPKLILSGRSINDSMSKYIFNQIIKHFDKKKKLRVNIMGLTFKENCPDIRNSKVIDLINYFIEKNHKVNLFDPYLDSINLNNHNKQKVKSIKEFKKADVILIAVSHNQFLKYNIKFFTEHVCKNGIIFDVKGKFGKLKNTQKYKYKYKYISL